MQLHKNEWWQKRRIIVFLGIDMTCDSAKIYLFVLFNDINGWQEVKDCKNAIDRLLLLYIMRILKYELPISISM